MWIKINDGTKKLSDPDVSDESIKFNDNGKVQVSKSIGKKFVEKYDSISKTETKKDKKYDEVS